MIFLCKPHMTCLHFLVIFNFCILSLVIQNSNYSVKYVNCKDVENYIFGKFFGVCILVKW